MRLGALALLVVLPPACASVGPVNMTVSAGASIGPVKTALPACGGAVGRAPGWADYFPEKTFDDKPDFHNDYTLKWYGGELAAMGEPVLSCPRTTDAEVYRLLFASSWRAVWAVRVERVAGGAELQATRLPVWRPNAPRHPLERRVRHLSPAEWERVTAAFRSADFWSMPSPEPPIGLDGETWVVEGLRGRDYHAIERWSPRWDSPARAVGAVLLELAGLGALAVDPPPTSLPLVGPEDLGP